MSYKFGKQQLSNPTPASISKIIDIISAIAGFLVTWIGTASYIPDKVSLVIGSLLGLIVGISQVLKPFFGVTVSGKVDSSDVDVIDESAAKKDNP